MSDFKIVKLVDAITLNVGGPTFKGEYDNATTYNIGESVSYLGSSYVAYTVTTGNIPTDISFWQILAEKGVAGGDSLNITCRNISGATILKGSVVYISGATANRPTIELAQANNPITASRTIGLAVNNISNNSTGTVIDFGLLDNVDTSAFLEGDELYLSESVLGGLTTTPPIQPDYIIKIGIVLESSAVNGQIQINIDTGESINELHDVLIVAPANEEFLQYHEPSGLWKNTNRNTFETVSSNLKSWNYSLNYTLGELTSIIYTDGVDTITKTLYYTTGDLTSIELTGDTPAGINLVKTLTYTTGNLTGIAYS
tara:strand:+ start:1879 stop:2820 length:942 start_codon:yes stop_codon:yes gene_type:complete